MSDSLKNILNNNKELFWDIKNLDSLSDISIEERFLKYWDRRNIKDLLEVYWKDKFIKIYKEILSKQRCDLDKKTINFFNLFIEKNA